MTHPPATPEQWLQAFEAIVRARDFADGREMFADDAVAFGTWARAVSGLDNIVREQPPSTIFSPVKPENPQGADTLRTA